MSTLCLRSFSRAIGVFGLSLLCLAGAWTAQTWHTRDIGDTGAAGSAQNATSTILLCGAGNDIDDTTDAFRFLYQNVSGNVAITVRIATLENTHEQAKAGVMLRAGLDPESRNAYLCVTPNKGLSFLWRSKKGQCDCQSLTGVATPCWVKLVRNTDHIAAFYSADGSRWTNSAPVTLKMSDPIYLGMAVTSHVYGKCCAAIFDNMQVGNGLTTFQVTDKPESVQETGKPNGAKPARRPGYRATGDYHAGGRPGEH